VATVSQSLTDDLRFNGKASAAATGTCVEVDVYDPDVSVYEPDARNDKAAVLRSSIESDKPPSMTLSVRAKDGLREVLNLSPEETRAYLEGDLKARYAMKARKIKEKRYDVARKAVEEMREKNLTADQLTPYAEVCLWERDLLEEKPERVPLREGGYSMPIVARLREDAQERLVREDPGVYGSDDYSSDGSGRNAGYLDQEFISFGGPMSQQLYLNDYWDMLSKCFWAWHHDPVAQEGVNIIRNFVLGRGMTVTAKDERVQTFIDAFNKANGMKQRWKIWTTGVSRDGNLFIRKIPQGDGTMKVRSLPANSIWEIVTEAEDIENIYYYAQRYMCLDGDTRISLLDGTEPTIRELAHRHKSTGETFSVYSYDHKTKRIVPGENVTAIVSGVKRCVEVELDNGEKVVSSFDHPFLARNGEYVHAENLIPGQSLMPLYRKRGYEQVWQPEQGWKLTHQSFADSIGLDRTNRRHIDHIDGNKSNNAPSNLQSLAPGEHCAKTWADVGFTVRKRDSIKRVAAARTKPKSFKRSSEWRAKIGEKQKAYWARCTPEQIQERIEKTATGRDKWTAEHRAAIISKTVATRVKIFEPVVKRSDNRFDNRLGLFDAVVNHKVVSVRPVGDREVFDLTVPIYENFAVSSGVFVHNTRTQIFSPPDGDSQHWVERDLDADEVIHMKVNASDAEVFGRSDLFVVLGYLKRLRDMSTTAVLKEQAQAAYVFDASIKGGKTDVDNFIATALPKGKPQPGSIFAHNEAATIQVLNSGKNSGSTGAGSNFEGLLSMIAMGLGIAKDYLGVTSRGSRATSLVATEPTAMRFEERQDTLGDKAEQLYQDVIDEGRRYGYMAGVEDFSFTITFPEIQKDDAANKVDLINQGVGMQYLSHATAADMYATEVDIDDYDYDAELAQIEKEMSSANPPLILTKYACVPMGDTSTGVAGASFDDGNAPQATPAQGALPSGATPQRALPAASPGSAAGAAQIRNKMCAAVCGREGTIKSKGTPHWFCDSCAKAYKINA
jgi:hypothetical protein